MDFVMALLFAPPGRMTGTAQLLLDTKPAPHRLFVEAAEIAHPSGCRHRQGVGMDSNAPKIEKGGIFSTFEAGILLKTNKTENALCLCH